MLEVREDLLDYCRVFDAGEIPTLATRVGHRLKNAEEIGVIGPVAGSVMSAVGLFLLLAAHK